MRIERQMHRVERHVGLAHHFELLAKNPRHRLHSGPKEPVMHDEQGTTAEHRRFLDHRQTGVDRSEHALHVSAVLHLQSVVCPRIVLHLRHPQVALRIRNDRLEFCHGCIFPLPPRRPQSNSPIKVPSATTIGRVSVEVMQNWIVGHLRADSLRPNSPRMPASPRAHCKSHS